MKRARQHGKPDPSAAEELEREIRDAELDVTERRLPRGGYGDALTTNRRAQEDVSRADVDR
ncbi:hypothetical protein ACFU5O_15285 [Streptomyces sp. NPDC057445]|uniref:hypothetical protein n=1 Tax=Streptomyces sp. NPDC057445 TaxID=3346136 RepID=UPI0036BDCDC4